MIIYNAWSLRRYKSKCVVLNKAVTAPSVSPHNGAKSAKCCYCKLPPPCIALHILVDYIIYIALFLTYIIHVLQDTASRVAQYDESLKGNIQSHCNMYAFGICYLLSHK